jgi:hypothetical protein
MKLWHIDSIIDTGRYYKCRTTPRHPKANKDGYVYLHIAVAENNIGRRLKQNEVVHHRDEDKMNCNRANLVVVDRAVHSSHHHRTGVSMVVLSCPWCMKKFVREVRLTHLGRPGTYTACSRQCSGKMGKVLQQLGSNNTSIRRVLRGNVIGTFIK